MDTCAHHVGPREYRPFCAIEHRQLFTQPPRSPILRSSWPIGGCAVPRRGVSCPSHSRARRNSSASDPSTKEKGVSENQQDGSQPTVVLVHGAFADGSSWNDVIERLQAEGLQVTAPANPLRGISIDSAYLNSLLEQIPGPVLAVGHSYGGAGITNAATNANNAAGLVYVAAL